MQIWSWTRTTNYTGVSRIWDAFHAHDGAIFGIRLSTSIWSTEGGDNRRLLATCSDDRSIKVWTISTELCREFASHLMAAGQSDKERWLAVGWGHSSRVWRVYFHGPPSGQFVDITDVELVSLGEDACVRVWRLYPQNQHRSKETPPFAMESIELVACHSGKNLWSSLFLCGRPTSEDTMIIGAADGKMAAFPRSCFSVCRSKNAQARAYGSKGALSSARKCGEFPRNVAATPFMLPARTSSGAAGLIRSYAFINDTSFLATSCSGEIFLGYVKRHSSTSLPGFSLPTDAVERANQLCGYSTCASDPSSDIVFLSGKEGHILAFSPQWGFKSLFNTGGTVAGLFTCVCRGPSFTGKSVLLAAPVRHRTAHLLLINRVSSQHLAVVKSIQLEISEELTGTTVTAMICIHNKAGLFCALGFRRGAVAIYTVAEAIDADATGVTSQASVARVIQAVHGQEAVTSLGWVPSHCETLGHLLSVGRDGHFIIHFLDLSANFVWQVHRAPLPGRPSLEGVYLLHGFVMVFGFHHGRFVLFNTATEEEVMEVDCGGSQRNWAFRPNESGIGGTLLWSQSSTMRACSQSQAKQIIIRTGLHGREIKTIATSLSSAIVGNETRHLVALGAEDTTIKIFEYDSAMAPFRLGGVRTLKKHTTGIQHLQWSEDGRRLFSSGGCEEFYCWRIRTVPVIGLCAVCDFARSPISGQTDSRITSFRVQQLTSAVEDTMPKFLIVMVLSDSRIEVGIASTAVTRG